MENTPIYDTADAVAIACHESGEPSPTAQEILDGHFQFLVLAGLADAEEEQESLASERMAHEDLLRELPPETMDREILVSYLERITEHSPDILRRVLSAEAHYMEGLGIVQPGTHADYLQWVMGAEIGSTAPEEVPSPTRPAPEPYRARILDYYSDYKHEPLVCPECGWEGIWAEGIKEHCGNIVDCSCPAKGCSSPMLALVSGGNL